MLEHERIQHCVGQGFFHSGRILLGPAQLRYVYDCGASKKWWSDLSREVVDYLERDLGFSTLDVLFVSHLHHDHVSGIDQLLAGPVRRVVLPYLNPVERLILIAKGPRRGGLDWHLSIAVDGSGGLVRAPWRRRGHLRPRFRGYRRPGA